jgi:hypothetical protein
MYGSLAKCSCKFLATSYKGDRTKVQMHRPVLINSATGLFNTLINVYTARGRSWSVTATVTAAVTGTFAFISSALFLVYNNWLFSRLERAFDAEMNAI